MNSSGWIDDALNKQRNEVKDNVTQMRSFATNIAAGCKDAGLTEEDTRQYAWGLISNSFPGMMTLFIKWIGEVYND